MTLIKRYPLATFVVIAYAISWILWSPFFCVWPGDITRGFIAFYSRRLWTTFLGCYSDMDY